MIIRNAARCKNCLDIIESTHVHDWVSCTCFTNEISNTGIFIDGGKDYIRFGGCRENFIDLAEYRDYKDGELLTDTTSSEESA